jgi:methyl-accepting chemotaxis protein
LSLSWSLPVTLRLSHKIILIAVLGVFGLAALEVIYMVGDSVQSGYRAEDEAARRLGDIQGRTLVALLETRRAEKDFLLRKDPKYVAAHAETAKGVATLLDQLQASGGSGELAGRIAAIRKGYAEYSAHFATLAEARTRLGLNEDSGLEGSLRKSVHGIETALKAHDLPRLAVTMLMMRRHEKDFMLRGDDKSPAEMKKRAGEFADQVKSSDLPEATKADLLDKLAAYQRDFAAWVEGARSLAAAQKQVSASFAAIEPEIAAADQIVRRVADTAKGAERTTREATRSRMQVAIVLIALLVGGLGFAISRAVARPLAAMVAAMLRLAGGDTSLSVPGAGRRDEIGEMAGAVGTFRDNMVEAERLRGEAAQAEALAAERRRTEMARMADAFEAAVGEIVSTVSEASTELEASAATLTRTAEHAQQVTSTVASASEEASTNVHSVAAATEELTGSVGEISRQVQDSARIAAEAVSQAQRTNDRVGELARAASRIGDVVELITTIAGQTNLLALNATIEAARAGEAGRGFAVVATEVKALADQTAKATGEISQQITGIQAATEQSVSAIREIGETIGRMSEIAATIASAVEEQGAATGEIARNIQQASVGTGQVATNIVEVERGATETGAASAQVLAAAQGLSRDSSRLRQEVDRFLETVRAA